MPAASAATGQRAHSWGAPMCPVMNEPVDHLSKSGKNAVGGWAAQERFHLFQDR